LPLPNRSPRVKNGRKSCCSPAASRRCCAVPHNKVVPPGSCRYSHGPTFLVTKNLVLRARVSAVNEVAPSEAGGIQYHAPGSPGATAPGFHALSWPAPRFAKPGACSPRRAPYPPKDQPTDPNTGYSCRQPCSTNCPVQSRRVWRFGLCGPQAGLFDRYLPQSQRGHPLRLPPPDDVRRGSTPRRLLAAVESPHTRRRPEPSPRRPFCQRPTCTSSDQKRPLPRSEPN